MEKEIRYNISQGTGGGSNLVDYVMYLSIVLVMAFGFVAYKKLQDQKDTLVI